MATILVTGLTLVGCTSEQDEPDSPTAAPQESGPAERGSVELGETRDVATGINAPWSIVFIGDTALISERDSGRILEMTPDGSTRTVDTIDDVVRPESGGGMGPEGGLLGLAVGDDDRLYVYSTGEEGNRIQRFDVTGAPGDLSLGEPDTILTGPGSGVYHNGGRIAFGPDGMLYVTVGETGRPEEAQDLDSLNGKILRMTPDGDVPEDNPFDDSYVYSYGHRNPQGLGWTEDGTMFSTEFGANSFDELNIIVAGGNYGWPEAEGTSDNEDYEDPVQQWEPADASPSGMTVIGDTIVIANLRGEVLRTVPVADPSASTEYFNAEFGRIRDVVPTPDGNLWFLTNNTDGRGEAGDGDDRVVSVEVAGLE
ncbi:PQQ-dependent sugar dehydrogenase [Corynebacterium glyciniphilum]|uniref:PQQ-dependent sugar dehydrogenase n=1 Tax=Corynebacterium glyciniphilum TaxID=1404244 RepID=UPI003DA1AB3D